MQRELGELLKGQAKKYPGISNTMEHTQVCSSHTLDGTTGQLAKGGTLLPNASRFGNGLYHTWYDTTAAAERATAAPT